MATTTRAQTAPATTATATWQMWVPCIGMALCSWLSFVDRQVLNILSPTIIKDTALTPQDFTTATSFFFLTYTLGNPVWGSILDRVGLRVGMLLAVGVWTAASMSHAMMSSFAGFALARAVLGIGEGGTKDTLEQCASSLIGRDPFKTEARWQEMYMAWFYPPGREKIHAQGALDMALWDIKGKVMKMPIHQILGGSVRNYCECYPTGGPGGPLHRMLQGMLEWRHAPRFGQRFRGFWKMLGGGWGLVSYKFRDRQFGSGGPMFGDEATEALFIRRLIVVATCVAGLYFIWQLAKGL